MTRIGLAGFRWRPSQPLGRDSIFYLFALPFAALTILFGLWPILLSIEVSFTASATALKPVPSFVGFANYAAILADPVFLASLGRTLLYTLLAVGANVGFALLYALLLDSALIGRGRMLFKLAVFLPWSHPTSPGTSSGGGSTTKALARSTPPCMGSVSPAFGGLASANTAMLSILVAELWHHAGFYVLIFLATWPSATKPCRRPAISTAPGHGANSSRSCCRNCGRPSP